MSVAALSLPQYRITTPEHVSFRYHVAGLVSRAMAWLLDQLVLRLAQAAVLFALGTTGTVGFALVLISFFAIDFGYYVVFELWWAGQSPGKRVMGLRVVSGSGAALSFHDVMLRNLVRPIDALPLVMTVGGAVALLDRYHRRLGDLAAGTLVVRDRRLSIPEALRHDAGRDNSFRADPAIRQRVLARVTREERDLMLELMLRRDTLEPEARERLFGAAAAHFRHRYGLPESHEHLTDEQTVLNLALLVQEPPAPRAGARKTAGSTTGS